MWYVWKEVSPLFLYSGLASFRQKPSKTKRLPEKIEKSCECTQSRGRTGTTLLSLVFETNASTDSAIWAYLRIGWAKVRHSSRFTKPLQSIFRKIVWFFSLLMRRPTPSTPRHWPQRPSKRCGNAVTTFGRSFRRYPRFRRVRCE